MRPKKTRQEREQEPRPLLATPAGQDQLQAIASRYCAASDRLKPTGTSAITYILVYEREQGLIHN